MSQAKYDKALEIVKKLPDTEVSSNVQLTFYGLYKQVLVGPPETPRPGLLDWTARAKWDAWNKVKDLSKEEAQAKYVEELLELLKKAIPKDSKTYLPDAEKYVAEIEAA
ncbi:acyl CoA binding protein-domain-containing protein [Mycena vulgaris]|nr:acyl CoA binding protein-domain-containing protein [Mycena vulgaris]